MNNTDEDDNNSVVSEENDADYTEDTFDKFLSDEESDLMKEK